MSESPKQFDKPHARAELDSPEAIERWRKALHDRYMNIDLVDSLCDLALKGLSMRSHVEENPDVFPQQFDCHYNGVWEDCDKVICKREKDCRRRSSAPSTTERIGTDWHNDWHKIADERSAEIVRLERELTAMCEECDYWHTRADDAEDALPAPAASTTACREWIWSLEQPEVSAWRWIETWDENALEFGVLRFHLGDKLAPNVACWRFIDPPNNSPDGGTQT